MLKEGFHYAFHEVSVPLFTLKISFSPHSGNNTYKGSNFVVTRNRRIQILSFMDDIKNVSLRIIIICQRLLLVSNTPQLLVNLSLKFCIILKTSLPLIKQRS